MPRYLLLLEVNIEDNELSPKPWYSVVTEQKVLGDFRSLAQANIFKKIMEKENKGRLFIEEIKDGTSIS